MMFLDLLPEVQDIVVSYCTVEDLRNMALLNREYNYLLNEHLSHTVRITEAMLERKDFLTDRRLHEMRLRLESTKVLRISICTDIVYQAFSIRQSAS